MELALEWLESQRVVMHDPTKAHWFLQYTDGAGHKNGTIYDDYLPDPNGHMPPGSQYFWCVRTVDSSDQAQHADPNYNSQLHYSTPIS